MSEISVIINNEVIQVTEVDDEISISFPIGGGVTDHGVLTGLADNDHTQYQLAAGLGTAAFLNVGTGANQVVQLTAASKLPAVDGSLLTNLPSGGGSPGGSTTQVQYNNAGAFAGHSDFTYNGAGVATLSTGLVVPKVYPAADSTNAFGLYRANGTTQDFYYDSVNGRIGINVHPTLGRLEFFESTVAQPTIYIDHRTNANVISVVKATGIGSMMDISFVSGQANGIIFTNTDAGSTFSNGTMIGIKSALSCGYDILGGIKAGIFQATSTRTSQGSNPDKVYGLDVTATSSITTAGVFGYAVFATAGTKNITPIYAKLGSGAGSSDAVGIDLVNSSSTRVFSVNALGSVVVGHANTATSYLDLAASTTTLASLRIRNGAAPTTPNAGDIWYPTSGRLSLHRAATETIASGVQATGGAATATAVYTATEQLMLQKCYDVCRAFGLLN